MSENTNEKMPPKGAQIPLLDVTSVDEVLEFAKNWEANGKTHVEVLLRSDNALNAIATIRKETGLCVAAGTILDVGQLIDAAQAGAHLAISPGLLPKLVLKALDEGIPIIPGVHSPSEIQLARSMGLHLLKFFPASIGGVQFLREIEPVFPDIMFIPSGGVRKENYQEFLSLNNVRAVGGRWMLSTQ